MPSKHPVRRPTDASYLNDNGPDLPSSLLNLPWIDCHNHVQTLSWNDRERYALAGCEAMVMVMVASGYHWTPYKPVTAAVRFLWDDAINLRRAIEQSHFFDTNLALGVHTGVRVENPDDLLAADRRHVHRCRGDGSRARSGPHYSLDGLRERPPNGRSFGEADDPRTVPPRDRRGERPADRPREASGGLRTGRVIQRDMMTTGGSRCLPVYRHPRRRR